MLSYKNNEMLKGKSDNILFNEALLSRMSHEVRTNMNYILAYSYFMGQQSSPICYTEMSSQIRNSCKQLLGLVDNFIESMMVDNGRSKYSPKVFNLHDFADKLYEDLNQSVKAEDDKELSFTIQNNIGSKVKAAVDSSIVTKILENLVYISLLNTDNGYIKLTFDYKDKNLNISVSDSGNGYRKCKDFIESDNIMTPFSMYNDAATAININFTKQLIEQLNGSINVEENESEGTCFKLSLPLNKREPNPFFGSAVEKTIVQ